MTPTPCPHKEWKADHPRRVQIGRLNVGELMLHTQSYGLAVCDKMELDKTITGRDVRKILNGLGECVAEISRAVSEIDERTDSLFYVSKVQQNQLDEIIEVLKKDKAPYHRRANHSLREMIGNFFRSISL